VYRKTLTFVDVGGTQHAIPTGRVLDIRQNAEGKVFILLSSNEVIEVKTPTYTDLVMAFDTLSDSLQSYV
jgi:hypothetical protein